MYVHMLTSPGVSFLISYDVHEGISLYSQPGHGSGRYTVASGILEAATGVQ